MRRSHTTPGGKAKCLAYRHGRRCRRVAVFEVNLASGGHQTMCAECTDYAVEAGAEIIQSSRSGFTVHDASGFSGYVTREYRRIG